MEYGLGILVLVATAYLPVMDNSDGRDSSPFGRAQDRPATARGQRTASCGCSQSEGNAHDRRYSSSSA